MSLFIRLLTWWNSQTIGTQIFTARKGVKVGEDEAGNIFYQTRDGMLHGGLQARPAGRAGLGMTGTTHGGQGAQVGGLAGLQATTRVTRSKRVVMMLP